MIDRPSAIDLVKAEIAAIKSKYSMEIAPLVARLDKLEAEALAREGMIEIDDDESAMREHINLMM